MCESMSKSSWISVEILILAVIVAISMTVTSVLHNNDIDSHTISINENSQAISDINEKVLELEKE